MSGCTAGWMATAPVAMRKLWPSCAAITCLVPTAPPAPGRVFHHHRLAEALGQVLGDGARGDLDGPAGA
jgi:hypothetical protein